MLKKHIVKLKKTRFLFWNELGSQAIQDVIERIERAYQRFFKGRKHNAHIRPPSFKKRSKYSSFTLKQAGYKYLGGNRVRIGKRTFKFFKSRDIEGVIKTLTVKRDACGDCYVIFVCETGQSQAVVARTGKSAGFDFGLKKFLTASDGNDKESPLFLIRAMRHVRKLSRRLSKKMKDSSNRRRARLALAREYRHVAAKRSDFLWKLALELIREYDILCFEDLHLKGMQALYGKKISDLGFGEFVLILKHLAAKHGKQVVFVDRFYASSQICHHCGVKNPATKDLKVREWTCPCCGKFHDRDRNAALNILSEGLRMLSGQDIVREESFCKTAATQLGTLIS